MREIAERMSISMAKVGTLSRYLKQHFSEPERENSVPQRVLSLLWVGPLSLKRIHQALPDLDPEAVDVAVEALRRDERVARLPGRTARFELADHAHRTVEDGWMARIDALGQMMRTASHVVEGRFTRGDERTFSRTVPFRVIPGRLESLRAFYDDYVFPAIVAADAESTDRDDAEP